MQRVLSVSLSHAFRSAFYLLLPFAFIALIAWATAGSSTGSTTDPIRGAIWIWLGAHHIPFQLALPPSGIAGYLTYLPLGGLLLPFLIIRSTFNRALGRLQGDFHDINVVRLTFAIFYSALVTALAWLSSSVAVTPQWYLAPIFGFSVALIATFTAGARISASRALRTALQIVALAVGVGLISTGILLITNFEQVKIITISLQPGFFGGALLLLLNILYLPNIAIGLLAYFSGSGVAVGADTIVSPWWYELGQIPALPLLGILPTGRAPLALFGITLFIALGALLAFWSQERGLPTLIQSFILTLAIFILLAYWSSGSLITNEMGAVGVSIWKFTLSIAMQMGIGAGLTTLIIGQVSARKR
jgi:hypothetical protein